MMANQLALLDLSTAARTIRAGSGGSAPPDAVAQRFAKCWTAVKLKSPAPVERERRADVPDSETDRGVQRSERHPALAAEPRDLEFPRPSWGSVKLTNVYLSNGEFSVPLLFSDPTTAHGGYFDNPTVMNMLLCGASNGAVDPCPPNVVP